MKKSNKLTLSMLLLTSGIVLQAEHHNHHFTEESYDEMHHVDKDRNDNQYDGTTISTADEHDAYDTAHHLDKHRQNHEQRMHEEKMNKNLERENDKLQNEEQKLQREIDKKHKKLNAMNHSTQKSTPTKTTSTKKKISKKKDQPQTWAEYFNSLI